MYIEGENGMKKTEDKNEMPKKQMKTMQTFLWTMTILIQMTVVACLDVQAETTPPQEITKSFSVYAEKEACSQPEVSYEEDGAVYELSRWWAESVTIEPVAKTVTEKVLYNQMEGNDGIANAIVILAEDASRGQSVSVTANLKEQEILRESWVDDFSFTVTFHTYGAGFYELQDRLIPYNEEQPDLMGNEELLLETIGVSPAEYEITSIRWAGDTYVDEQGEICRDAVAAGKKLLRDYKVTYEGTAQFPSWEGWQTHAVYRHVEEVTEAQTEPVVSVVTALQTEKEEPELVTEVPVPLSLWKRITRTLMITIAIGAFLFLSGLIVLLLLQVEKKIRSWYNRKKTN